VPALANHYMHDHPPSPGVFAGTSVCAGRHRSWDLPQPRRVLLVRAG